MEAEVDRIQAHAVHALVEPEAHVVQRRGAHRRVVEIEVGLRRQEVVQVVLAASRFPLPGHAAEQRQPVVGRAAVRLRIGPDVPVGLVVAAAFAALAEPRVLARRMAEDLVDHHADAESVGLRQQAVEVVEGAEQRIDVAIVGDVVAEVGHRRLEERRDPDRVDAEVGDVVQFLDDARQVADAVTVAVHETARVDLVDHRATPPATRRHPHPRIDMALNCSSALRFPFPRIAGEGKSGGVDPAHFRCTGSESTTNPRVAATRGGATLFHTAKAHTMTRPLRPR